MKTIDQHSFKGEKALIRVDFNVPINSEMQLQMTPYASGTTDHK